MNSLDMLLCPFTACLMLAPVLGYLGLHVIRREVVFIDMAVAQFAAVGAVAAHLFLHVGGGSPTAMTAAWVATVLAGIFYAVTRRYAIGFPLEAMIGISYASAAALSLLLIGKGTGGHTHIQQMLSGKLLWVSWRDVGWSAVWFGAAGGLAFVFRRAFQKISDDYEAALAAGMRVVLWDILFYAVCGMVITVAVRLAGIVVVFAFLIIPATVAILFAERWHIRLVVAAIFGIIAAAMGLTFCQLADFSAGVSVAFWLAVLLAAAVIPRVVFFRGKA